MRRQMLVKLHDLGLALDVPRWRYSIIVPLLKIGHNRNASRMRITNGSLSSRADGRWLGSGSHEHAACILCMPRGSLVQLRDADRVVQQGRGDVGCSEKKKGRIRVAGRSGQIREYSLALVSERSFLLGNFRRGEHGEGGGSSFQDGIVEA